MTGDNQKRYCAGCQCHVHNLEAYPAEEAESLVQQSGHICTRVIAHPTKGILTRDGWVARLATAGAIAAALAGCTDGAIENFATSTGDSNTPQAQVPDDGKRTVPIKNRNQQIMGEIAMPQVPIMGAIAPPETKTTRDKK